MNIRQIKLVNGDDIIAIVQSVNKTNLLIERPIKIELCGDGDFKFMPWFALSSETMFTICDRTVVHHVEVDEEIKYAYINYATRNDDYEDILDDDTFDTDTSNNDRKIVH